MTALTYLPALNDAKGQLGGLVYSGFVSATGLEQLRHLPRYLAGITQRMQALPTNPGRDRAWQTQVETAVALYTDAGGRIPLAPGAPPAIVHARWMLEEFRVSLFAQSLGTAETVLLDDDWTVITADGRASAHFEHTFAVTEDGPWVLTALDGGASRGFLGRDERIKEGAQS